MKFSSKQWVFVLLALITLFGLFLRTYHFSDWLHFELDQSRDARVIDHALSGGPGDLPLLGPKAGGTFLRLAPGYYYLQYLSGVIFGGTPAGVAAFVVVFSVLSIPVFFFLIRRFFVAWLAFFLTTLFAVSEFFVMYGRFAWNPNLIPFFVLLGFYALLRAVDEQEMKREGWFLLSVFSLVLATHFHFLVFLSAPLVIGIFLLIKRPRFSWKTWVAAFGILGLLYLPMVLNEIETGGQNTKEFFGAITEKSTKEDHSLVEKGIRNVREHVLHALVITSGFERGTLPSFKVDNGLHWTCNEKCDRGKWYGVGSALVFLMSMLSFFILWWRETERKKKDFLLLCGIWFSVTFTLFLPLSYGVAPRFFLLSGMFFFILLGCFFVLLLQLFRNHFLVRNAIVFSLIALVGMNLFFLEQRFNELSRAGKENVTSAPDRILKERIRVTLEQQNSIIDMLENRSRETGYPVYMFSEPQYRRALKYLMERRGIENAVLGYDGVYEEGIYFLILRTRSNINDALKKYHENYIIGDKKYFGTLVAIELFPKPEAIIGKRQDFSISKPNDSQAPPRYTWREFFEKNKSDGSLPAEDDSSLDQSEDAIQDEENE